jgi:hypothetical protein
VAHTIGAVRIGAAGGRYRIDAHGSGRSRRPRRRGRAGSPPSPEWSVALAPGEQHQERHEHDHQQQVRIHPSLLWGPPAAAAGIRKGPLRCASARIEMAWLGMRRRVVSSQKVRVGSCNRQPLEAAASLRR